MRKKEKGYVSISLPRNLIREIDRLVGHHGYTSRAEVIKEALRRYLENKKLPPRTHDENGGR
ncbi:MAG: ribbon-helix-helix domain-containing protein [Candidatus Bathyarchaeia archaeon]